VSKALAPEPQTQIVIERRIHIATITEDRYGTTPMVVAAFTAAGEYLNEEASKGNDPADLSFEYQGVTFWAGYNTKIAPTASEDLD
jgi:hypothetical protein